MFREEAAELKLLGSPSWHVHKAVTNHPDCDVKYHTLEYATSFLGERGDFLADHEGKDWIFQLYQGDLEDEAELPNLEPLVASELLRVCDGQGKHVDKSNRFQYRCVWEDDGPVVEDLKGYTTYRGSIGKNGLVLETNGGSKSFWEHASQVSTFELSLGGLFSMVFVIWGISILRRCYKKDKRLKL
ncbi:hypothetical protein BU24DRAFT_428904 [Aaosphaeria arxii CBS 175.79]|uniref:Uncharacterized protein n=1 Tax=Aaosphaeria arxii CBS 175.79 TaxID=1450172 RepID=A0A6A5X7K0_9PLEO|nr:uncharacterized protein BU24DRAFT_428904 [Aaosphaeria arxii CBS 175.79]KAF2008913.1 hypothetical protein BU24DRAFT_428904 [Aaosphaeria arxii CBS 175.79]